MTLQLKQDQDLQSLKISFSELFKMKEPLEIYLSEFEEISIMMLQLLWFAIQQRGKGKETSIHIKGSETYERFQLMGVEWSQFCEVKYDQN